MRKAIGYMMFYIRVYTEVPFVRLFIWYIKRGYGANCPDYEEKCPSCEAKKIVDWLEDHVKLIKGEF